MSKCATEPSSRKISFKTDRDLPSFQETDEVPLHHEQSKSLEVPHNMFDSSHIPLSEPIKIKKLSDVSHPNNSDPIRTSMQETSSISSCPIAIKVCALEGSAENLSPGTLDV